jgi:hypothetical protein
VYGCVARARARARVYLYIGFWTCQRLLHCIMTVIAVAKHCKICINAL